MADSSKILTAFMCLGKGRARRAALMSGVIALVIMAGCISPDSDDPFAGYFPQLQSNPDHFIRVATSYDPDLTPEGTREAARHYGLEAGTPANVGRWASLLVVVYGDAKDAPENRDGQGSGDDANDGDDGPLCDQVEPGSLLAGDPEKSWKRYCVSLDEDEHGRTHFFLPEGDSYLVGFGIQGLAVNRAAEDRDDCRAPMYWSGGDGRAPSVQAEPIPGRIEINDNKDVILHFGITCMV